MQNCTYLQQAPTSQVTLRFFGKLRFSIGESLLKGLVHCGLILTFFMVFQARASAQVILSLQYKEKNNVTTLPAGQLYTMQLDYSVSSTTGNASGVQAVIHLPDNIIDVANFAGTTHAPAGNFVFDNTPGAKKLTINFIEPVPSGSTGVLEVGLILNNGTIPDGTTLTTTAEMTGTGGFSSGIKSHTITVTAAPYLCALKSFVGGGALDNVTTYAIRVSASDLTYGFVPYGFLNATNITLTDNLPAGAEFVSAQLIDIASGNPVSATINQSNGVITTVIPDISTSRYGMFQWRTNIYELQIKVKYNTSSGFTAGQTVNNVASLVFTPFGGSPITVTDGSKVSLNACVNDLQESVVLTNPIINAYLTKTRSFGVPEEILPGQTFSYCINFKNSGNVDLNNVEIIENIPSTLRFAGTSMSPSGMIDHFEYQTNLNNSWTTGALTGSAPGPDPNNSAEYYTKLKIVLKSPLPPNASLPNYGSTCPFFAFIAATETTADTPVQNCVEWNSTTVGIPADRTVCDGSITLKPRPVKSIVFMRTDHAPACAAPYVIGQVLDNSLMVAANLGGDDLGNPVLMLFPGPAGAFEYVPGSATFVPGTSGLTVTPTFEYIPDYAGTGRFLLRWTFPAGTKLPHGTNMSVNAKVKITNAVSSGQELRAYVSGSNISSFTHYNGGPSITETDIYDLNNNNSTTDTLGTSETSYNSCHVNVAASASMESIKWVKGQLDSDYSRYPAFGQTVRGGNADYKLVVRNTGNVPMKDIRIIDILPFAGDRGVIDTSPRSTEWRPNLAGPINAPAGTTVYYSTQSNPCRDEMKAASDPSPFPTGCASANWSVTPPADITKVQSVMIDFGTKVLAGADSLVFNWPMRAPNNAPVNGEIAWNSFGFVATRTDNNQALLAAEPIKVGIQVHAPTPAFYGDRVWFDTNRNGIQDAGEGGVDGVTVKLFYPKGATANPAVDSLVNFTITGNGGMYLFSNLKPGNYYAVFYVPGQYLISPTNSGNDSSVDSDGFPTTLNGVPVTITAITNLTANETDLTWDQGIYCNFTPTIISNSPVIAGETLILTASGGTTYSWSGPNGFNATGNIVNIPNVSPGNAGDYTVNISDAGGCYASLNTSVVINTCTKPNAGTDQKLACKDPVSNTLTTSTSLTGFTPSGGTWTPQAGNSAAATVTNAGVVSGMTVAGTYKFIYALNGCADTVAVSVEACSGCTKPNAGSDQNGICSPASTATLEGFTPAGGVWTVQAGNPATATITNAGVVSGMTTAGTYKFIYSVSSGGETCSDTVAVTINAKPNAGDDRVTCTGNKIQLTSNTAGETWTPQAGNPAGVNINPTTGLTDTFTVAGDYYFVLTSPEGCTDMVKITVSANCPCQDDTCVPIGISKMKSSGK